MLLRFWGALISCSGKRIGEGRYDRVECRKDSGGAFDMKLYGLNILTGMAITARHFVETYVEDFKYWFGHKRRQTAFRNQPDEIGSFTVQYPEQKLKVPERFRMLPVL